ncbi:enterochelin esterase-like enzyme/quercetin dioxygenase-like cupin family protein [Saonia flava]|uniref:Enterochelin esterase-like enzyme/quercetin dioxygenase-like cupin family protein n=1 Tax=Saonia flava TaxID=523696 RepID=A0A846QRM5_9FLAO|nr:cupin domain-containing protein [Saonia flava]NJB69847.1 enterochelin esterase-like enzyme/quercetin dioxygenase-like cupin family protein [Saonia flava]
MKHLRQFSVVLFCLGITILKAQDDYEHGPNSWSYEGIPKGVVTKYSWESTVFANTIRDYYVYVPAQYDASKPAALMVFQDGHSYVDPDGDFNVPVVFDNLIAQGKMPVTIGLFINPGHDKSAPAAESPWRVTNRSFEYDDVTGLYGDFLLKEMIPELKKDYTISDDPKMRAIGGLSSGAICAFSVAWFHTDSFQKVLSHFGSYTDIRGGHNYPPMIRKNDKKDIKIFMEDGSNDLDNEYGNWWLANLQMESALTYKDYEHIFIAGNGGHNGKHAGSILPESLEWLWSDRVPKKVEAKVYSLEEDELSSVLIKGETNHFNDMVFNINYLSKAEKKTLYNTKKEQILIVKEGDLKVNVNGISKTVGPNSVMLVLPGDTGEIEILSDKASYYQMTYSSDDMDLARGKEEGSAIYNFEEIEFKEHDKGGIRNYFHRKTTMCPYYEMHVTNLNGGIKSHEPHTHGAAEIILMIKGETEMEIGNKKYQAKAGDVYYASSNIPHAIRNLGDEQSMYFAFQWD